MSTDKIETTPLTAADLLPVHGVGHHPLHKTFMAWCKEKGTEPSKRQARKFLQKYPQYRA